MDESLYCVQEEHNLSLLEEYHYIDDDNSDDDNSDDGDSSIAICVC